jgi:hypothetical protein
MNFVGGVISVLAFVLIGSGWFYFIKGHPLSAAIEIREISISYSENIGDLLPDDYDPKEFTLRKPDEINRILEILGDVPISRMPLIDSNEIDEGPGWMLNVYFENGDYRYISIDKNHVSGKIIKNSKIFRFLNDNYT